MCRSTNRALACRTGVESRSADSIDQWRVYIRAEELDSECDACDRIPWRVVQA
jgi:hypothetical protein